MSTTTIPPSAAALGMTQAEWDEGVEACVAIRLQGNRAGADEMRATVIRELSAEYDKQAEATLEAYQAAERAWASSPEVRDAYGEDQAAFIRNRMGHEPHRATAGQGALQLHGDPNTIAMQRLEAWTASLQDRSPGHEQRSKLAKLRYLEVRPNR